MAIHPPPLSPAGWGDPGRAIDRKRLEAAVGSANLPTLLMVIVQLTGNRRWLQSPYRPTRPRGLGPHDGGGFAEEVAAEIRRAAVEAVCAWADGADPALPAPDPTLLRYMQSTCMGEEVPDEYQRLMREELGIADAGVRRLHDQTEGFSVLIVGAGISGLMAGARLREMGIPFRIIERLDDVGGVWLTNRYPGAGVDTPSYLYSYSFFPRNWSTHFGKRDEMAAYTREAAEHFDLRRDITFGVEVERLAYDEEAQRWTAHARGRDGAAETYTANAVITAVGLFNKPRRPDIPGLDRFGGPLFHTAEWPGDLDLTGRRVAVIGTGASSMQVVPAIVDRVGSLTVFQRSPQWVAPNDEYFAQVGDDVHWLMEHVPYYHEWYRFRLAWTFNDRVHGSLQVDPQWQHPERSLNAVNDGHRRAFTRYLMQQLEGREDLQRKALPDYPPFGKRMLLDNGWFQALRHDNLELVVEGVAEVTETGVVTTAGDSFEVDVVILATGFDTCRYLQPMEVQGRDGRQLRDEWGDDDGRAYLGITAPGYPNLFLMYGPNTNSGAGGSYIFIGECQMRYIADLLAMMVEQGLGAVDCRPEVRDKWVRDVDEAHANMIWTHPGMDTYYRNARGRVVVNMPYRIIDYWAMTHDADLSCYTTEPRRSARPGPDGDADSQ